VVRVAQSLVFCVVFGVVYRWFFNNKQHKILHIKLKIGQHEPHYETNDKQHKIQQRKPQIGQHEPHYKTHDKEQKILHRKLKIGQHEPLFIVGFIVWFMLPNL
jgi:hypothetical protein